MWNWKLLWPSAHFVHLSCLLAAKVVDLDPCFSKKAVEDSTCHPYNTRGSMSEVQSLSSFQSESCDDNGMCAFCSNWYWIVFTISIIGMIPALIYNLFKSFL